MERIPSKTGLKLGLVTLAVAALFQFGTASNAQETVIAGPYNLNGTTQSVASALINLGTRIFPFLQGFNDVGSECAVELNDGNIFTVAESDPDNGDVFCQGITAPDSSGNATYFYNQAGVAMFGAINPADTSTDINIVNQPINGLSEVYGGVLVNNSIYFAGINSLGQSVILSNTGEEIILRDNPSNMSRVETIDSDQNIAAILNYSSFDPITFESEQIGSVATYDLTTQSTQKLKSYEVPNSFAESYVVDGSHVFILSSNLFDQSQSVTKFDRASRDILDTYPVPQGTDLAGFITNGEKVYGIGNDQDENSIIGENFITDLSTGAKSPIPGIDPSKVIKNIAIKGSHTVITYSNPDGTDTRLIAIPTQNLYPAPIPTVTNTSTSTASLTTTATSTSIPTPSPTSTSSLTPTATLSDTPTPKDTSTETPTATITINPLQRFFLPLVIRSN